MKQIFPVLMLLLASCDRAERPEAPTAAETERLDDADAMLDNLANEEEPATEVADPSSN